MKLIICGKTYEITHNKHISGGEFHTIPPRIVIGTKGGRERTAEVLLHEVLELILAEKDYRYQIYPNDTSDNYLFSFNHRDFISLVQELAYVLRQLGKVGNGRLGKT